MTKMYIRHSIITTLLILISDQLPAQELTVQSFTLSPTEIIPANDLRNDLNGMACALVKVQVIDNIDRVEGNVIGDIIKRGTEKWVFLTNGTKEFRLYPTNHLPLSIVCKEYDIDGLESKRVYILRLTSSQAMITPESPKQEQKDSVKINEPKQEVPDTNIEQESSTESVLYDQEPEYQYSDRPKHSSNNTVAFGIRAGANLAWTQFSDGYDDVGMAPSIHVGVSLDIPFSDNFYLNTALLYSGKGYKYDKVEKASAQYIDLPVQLSLRFGDIDETQFQVNAGPYVAMGLSGTIKSENGNKEQRFFDYYKSFDYGIVAGIGLTFSSHYYVGANLQLGTADYRNRNISISLGYNF